MRRYRVGFGPHEPRHRRRNARSRRIGAFLLAIAISLGSMLPAFQPQAGMAVNCSEMTKFVEQGSGTTRYYGNRDAIYTYNDVPCGGSGGVNSQSTFMRLRDDYLSWIEVGVQLDGNGRPHYWTEWRAYPAGIVVKYYDSAGTPAIGAYYSFEITDIGNGYFGIYRAAGSNPDTASWSFVQIADQMTRDVGQAESEEAHYGSGSAFDYALKLETQSATGGAWSLWSNLQCDQSQNSMPGWYAQKLSNSSWSNNQNAPGIC